MLIQNKKAKFNYEIMEKLTSGIELIGTEVKSVRAGHGNIDSAYAVVRGGEAFLIGADIPAYQKKNSPPDFDSARNRKLLLTKKEIAYLSEQEQQKGLTIVPLSFYNKASKIKVDIAIVRGKKKFDKRESLKKRETDREIRRTLKNR